MASKSSSKNAKRPIRSSAPLNATSATRTVMPGRRFAPDDVVKKEETNAVHSLVEHLTGGDRTWTIKELALWGGIGGVGPVFVGSAATIADILQEWVEETDVDGFNLAYALTQETFEDIVNFLVPELQRRGAYPKTYAPGRTLRERLFGAGSYLPANHPAAQYRDIEAFKRSDRASSVAESEPALTAGEL